MLIFAIKLVLLGGLVQTIQATESQVKALKKGVSVSVRIRQLETLPEVGESFTLVGPMVEARAKLQGFAWEPGKNRITLQFSPLE